MIPPLMCFTTFNKVDMTRKTLPSYLNTNQDFQLYICDNDSRDDTWDYVQSLRDPRIIQKKKFSRNFGSINSINWTLTHRKDKQSFINIEYDAFNLTADFVTKFEQVSNEFGAGFIHAVYVGEKKKRYTQTLLKNNVWFCPVSNPYKPPMSFCYIPYWVFNRIGYLDEASCLMDYEFITRITTGLGKEVGMTPSVASWHIEQDDILCPGSKLQRRVYPALCQYNMEQRKIIVRHRVEGRLPLKCGTYHLNTLTPEEEVMRKGAMEFMANYYEGYLKNL